MILEDRKRLQPLDTNSINLNDDLNSNSNIRRTRSRIHILPQVDQIIKDENLCRLQVNITKDFIYDEHNATISNISQRLSEDLTKPLKFNFRKRCVSTDSSSTESIPDCKSISNAESSTELNTFFKETLHNKSKKDLSDKTKKPSRDLDRSESAFYISEIYYTPSFKRIKPRKISVNVPRWRAIKGGNFRRTRNSLLAGQIENLSDQEYLDRHSKYEMEEKKIEEALQKSIFTSNKHRKSYDAQNFISPLNHVKKWQNVVPKTLETDHTNTYMISVKDQLPITAFGVTLPVIKSRQFQFERD